MLKSYLAHASMGAGIASDAWGRHLGEVKKTLEDIEKLHRTHLSGGVMRAREEFYSKRAALFTRLEGHLNKAASHGTDLRLRGSVKRTLEISTKSYLHTGEISRYAEKVSAVSKAANLVKRGTYLGIGLEVASSALDIQKACTLGREDECSKAKYVHGSSLVLGVAGGSAGGSIGGFAASAICTFALGITTGPGALACAVLGGAIGGGIGGEIGVYGGERIGDHLYRSTL